MYSFYRAWLSMGPGCGMPNLQNDLHLGQSQPNLSGAPDVNLLVGPSLTHFSAHKRILCFNSGFFKAALANHTGFEPITVPNVNVDEFSSLLTFMYTGFLDLNLSNIYNILLATHMLHMPNAMELCRNFLLHNQQIETRSNIIKPIPSRKSILPVQAIIHPTPLFGSLRQSTDTSFKSLTSKETVLPKNILQDQSKTKDHQQVEEKKKEIKNNPPIQIKKKTIPVIINNQESIKKPEDSEEMGVGKDKKYTKIKKRPSTTSSLVEEKYEIDVACCDGPVRFHRVLNKNFCQNHTDHLQPVTKYQPRVSMDNKNEAINRIMNENIREQNKASDAEDRASFSGEIFKCVYCNHTFKSQYCYQKHARRHLNPVLDSKIVNKPESTPSNNNNNNSNSKREVKLLDLNVQYYPCKMCGSKFPSYYFVHKHRKMCHSSENGIDDDVTVTREEERKSESKENESKNFEQENGNSG